MRPIFDSAKSSGSLGGEPPRVALVGVSGYARFYLDHLLALHEAGRARLVAATVINRPEEPLAVTRLESAGCRVFGDFESMLAGLDGRVDLCCLPTAIASHARLVARALRADLDVLVEKPFTATLADAARIQQQAAAARRFVAVGFQDIYNPATHRLKNLLRSGRIGRVRAIRVLGLWPREYYYYKRNAWAGRATLDGEWVNDSPCSNAFAHFLNLALFLASPAPLGVARAVAVEAERYRCQPIETFDTVLARLETDAGVTVHFQASHSGQDYAPVRVVVDGDEGRVEWTHIDRFRVLAADGRAAEADSLIGDEAQARDEMFARVLARCRDSDGFIFDAALASEHVRAVQAIHLAGATHSLDGRPELKRHRDPSGRETRATVAGLDEWLRRAFETGSSLAELGCPWARPRGRAPAEAFGLEAFASPPPARPAIPPAPPALTRA